MRQNVRQLEIHGMKMNYIRFGKEAAKPFVIIPGLSIKSVLDSSGMIMSAYAKVAQEYEVFLFDRREDVPEGYSLSDMAADTLAALKELGISSAVGFGTSQGGMILLKMAAEEPGLFEKIIVGSSSAYPQDRFGRVFQWLELAKAKDVEALMEDFGRSLYTEENFNKFKDAFRLLSHSITDEELQRFIRLANAVRGVDLRPELDKIKVPLLSIGARQDMVLGFEDAEEISILVPDGRCYIYEDYGHAVYDEATDYVDRILNFIKS